VVAVVGGDVVVEMLDVDVAIAAVGGGVGVGGATGVNVADVAAVETRGHVLNVVAAHKVDNWWQPLKFTFG
jgi:hypothetical protein